MWYYRITLHFKYADLIEHMVSVNQVIRIERKNDTHTIANKTFDFKSDNKTANKRRL